MSDKLKLGELEFEIFKIANNDRPFLVKVLAHLNKKFFDSTLLSKTFVIYKLFFEKFGKPPTKKILKRELEKAGEDNEKIDKHIEYIFEEQETISAEEREYIVDKVTSLAKRKNIEEAVFQITDILAKEEDLGDEDFGTMETKFRDALKYSMNVDIGWDLFDIDERYQAILDAVTEKITTGFNQIDHVLDGGVAKKELVAFQAPPGVGKCSVYDSEIEIEIDTDDPLYQKVKHLFDGYKTISRVKIGDLVESLGAINEGDDVSVDSTLKVNSPFGYRGIESVHKTQLNPEWEVETESGKKTIVADKHRLETRNGWFDESNNRYWTFAEELKSGDEIYTKDGWEKVVKCEFNGKHSAMYDLQVADTHSYYADDIHGHNTIWLVNLGFNFLKHGYNVVHYTLEMSEERLGLRYDGVASNIALRELTSNIDEVKAKYKTLKKITKSHLKLKEFPTSLASIYDIEAHLEHLKLQENFIPDALIVDYGDIMKSTRTTKNLYEEQGWIFRELRGLAVKQNVAVVTATQSNRGALKEDGGTSDLIGMDKTADSMEKNRILDVLFSVTQSVQDKNDGRLNLWVAKNRNGEANKMLEFLINYRNMKISEINLDSD